MRIAFDAKRALNNGTGLGTYARILLNALMRDYPDNEYLLFTPRAKDEFFNQLHGEFKLYFPETKFENSFKALWRSYGLTHKVVRKRCDIFHGLSNELPFNIHRCGIKTVVTIHDLIFLKHTEQYPWVDRQLYTAKTKYACKHADRIIAVSHETKHDLMEMYGVPQYKIEIVYQSADIGFTKNIAEADRRLVLARNHLPAKYILHVGSFFARKNQLKLLEAYAMVENKIEENLVLVGSDGNTLPAIQKFIRDNKLEKRVYIATNIHAYDLPAIYQSASAFVYPSLFEGFGIPVLEALFSRIPVIATKGGAIEEAAGSASAFINPNAADDIAGKIVSVLNNEPLRTQMTEAGYSHALTMTDNVFAEQTMKVYRSLL